MASSPTSYTPQQKRVIRDLLAAAGQFDASPREEKALLEAGRVESNFAALTGGDRDSTGVLQQRPSKGWGPIGESVKTDAMQFLKAARAARGVQGSAGVLAQAVQRSGFPDRYQEHSAEASALLGAAGPSTSSASTPSEGANDTGTSSAQTQANSTAGVEALLAAMQQPQQARTVAGLQAPSFSAAPTLASGAQVPASSGGPSRGDGVSPLLAAASALADTSTAPASSSDTSPGSSSESGGKASGTGPGGKFTPGDPVEGGTSIGGKHPTAGLDGFPARDYFAPAGSTAVAPVSGTVTRLSGHDPKAGPTNGPHGPLGWSVYIKGKDGKTYFLTHLGSRDVKPGEKIKAGTPIGTVADYDKYGTASHIHMGVAG